QVKQAINVVYNYTEAYTTFGLKAALAPDVPNNEGSFRAVTVTAPEGSVLNCLHPAPTAARHLLGHFLAGMVLAALAPVLPKRTVEPAPDQLLVIGLPGGGGLGSPLERDPELVRQDVMDELVSMEQARAAYGVAVTANAAVDAEETARLRGEDQ